MALPRFEPMSVPSTMCPNPSATYTSPIWSSLMGQLFVPEPRPSDDRRKPEPSRSPIFPLLHAHTPDGRNLLQELNFLSNVNRIAACCLTGLAVVTGDQAFTALNGGQCLCRKRVVAVLHRIHVRPHQLRNIDAKRTVCAALAALTAELRIGNVFLIGDKLQLFGRVVQIRCDRDVLIDLPIVCVARDRRGNGLVTQHPLE